MPFIALPHLTWDAGTKPDEFMLTTPLLYRCDYFDITFQVPKGFITDLASIPRIFRPLFPVNDIHGPAAILHDFLCRVEGEYRNLQLTRGEVDWIFLRAMKECGVPAWKRWAMYLAVRSYGLTFQRF